MTDRPTNQQGTVMAKSATLSNAILKLIFNGTPIANIADNAASSPATLLYVGLYTADPVGGNQTTNEVTYPGYSRPSVARTTGGWVVTGSSVSPVATITFPTGTGGGGTANYWGVGTASTGSGVLLYSGPLTFPYSLGSGIAPPLSSGSTFTEG